MPEHTDSANLLRAIAEAEADATAMTAPLTDAQANWLPGEGAAWSVAQCLDHLAKSNAVYTTHFLAVAEGARAAGGGTFQGLRPTWAGRWFVKSLEPPPRQKTRTFKNLVPPSSIPVAQGLAGYLAGRRALPAPGGRRCRGGPEPSGRRQSVHRDGPHAPVDRAAGDPGARLPAPVAGAAGGAAPRLPVAMMF